MLEQLILHSIFKYIEPEPRAESMFTPGCTAAYIDDLEFDNKLHSHWQK